MVSKERIKEAEEEAEAKKRPVRRVGGKLIKEDEDESCFPKKKVRKESEEEAEDEAGCKKESEDEAEDEKQMGAGIAAGRKRRREKESEDEEESEDVAKPTLRKEEEEEDDSALDDEEKEAYRRFKRKIKEAKKAVGLSQSPGESAAQSQTPEHTTSPGARTPSGPQNVFVPSSDVEGDRTQDIPAQSLGKSVEPDLTKSPLFVGINKQLDGLQETLSKKIGDAIQRVDAVEKSVNDRLKNIKADVEKIEKFYSRSFYKAIDESLGPEGLKAQPISKQLEEGKVQFRSK